MRAAGFITVLLFIVFAGMPAMAEELSCAPKPGIGKKLPDGSCRNYDCNDGTTFLFPENYVWEDGTYSIALDFDGQKVACRGNINMKACEKAHMLECEGSFEAYVRMDGCPAVDSAKVHHHAGHGDSGHVCDEGNELETFTPKEPAQDRPYIVEINALHAAEDISISITKPKKLFLGFYRSQEILAQTFSGHDYKTYQPNGPECEPTCRYGAELQLKELY